MFNECASNTLFSHTRRWLLESAYRSGKVILVVVSSGLVSGLKKSHTALTSPFGALENLSTLASTAPSAKLPHRMENKSVHSSVSSLQDRLTYTPSLGSRGSDHNLLATTVELAAHLGMKKPLFKVHTCDFVLYLYYMFVSSCLY